ncbi:MAG: hypothetical protein LBI14_03655 [Treponema sp.]|jgi:hypothetical protein|nr:hypothetical protein [Treponema sp.]
MVYGIISNNSISGISALNMAAGGKIALPVDPSSLLYSHFKNVSGVAAPEGSSGVTINKLNILDVLIEQMNQIKQKPEPIPVIDSEDRMAAMVEAKIDSIRDQILDVQEARSNMPYIQAPLAETGSLFSLVF